MSLSRQIKPISHLKAHAAELVRGLEETQEPLIITQNGEARAVLQGIESYERTQNALMLLKMLALGERQIQEGRTRAADEVFRELRAGADRD